MASASVTGDLLLNLSLPRALGMVYPCGTRLSSAHLRQIGRAFPEPSAVGGNYFDVAEPSGAVIDTKRDPPLVAGIIFEGEKGKTIELDPDARSMQGDLHLVPIVRLDCAGLRPDLSPGGIPRPDAQEMPVVGSPYLQLITFLRARAKTGTETPGACALVRLEGQVVVGPAQIAE
jgi:hypothetical protein